MIEPTVGDVYDEVVPRIVALRQQFFRDEATRWMLEPTDYRYPCFKCMKFHFRWSTVGKSHAADQGR